MRILGSHSFTRRRFAAGSRGSDGRYVAGASTDTTLQGSIQPDGRVQATGEFGERTGAQWRVLTTSELRPVDQAAGTLADRVVWDGVVFEVREEKQWTAVLPHHTCKIVQWQEQDPGPLPEPDESILQGVRSFFKAVLGITDAQIIPTNDKGPRPPLPYLTVNTDKADELDGQDSHVSTQADTLEVTGGTTGDTYSFTVYDETISYVRLAGDTDAEVAAALLVEVLATPGLTGSVEGEILALISLTGVALDTVVVSGALTLDAGAIPAETVDGLRTADIGIAGYGEVTVGWMTQALASLKLYTGITACRAAGIAIRVDGAASDAAAMMDTQIEQRWSRSLAVDYGLRGAGQTLTPLATIVLAGVLQSRTQGTNLSLDLEVEP